MGVLTMMGTGVGAYIMAMAVLSPCPLLVNETPGGAVIVSGLLAFVFHTHNEGKPCFCTQVMCEGSCSPPPLLFRRCWPGSSSSFLCPTWRWSSGWSWETKATAPWCGAALWCSWALCWEQWPCFLWSACTTSFRPESRATPDVPEWLTGSWGGYCCLRTGQISLRLTHRCVRFDWLASSPDLTKSFQNYALFQF